MLIEAMLIATLATTKVMVIDTGYNQSKDITHTVVSSPDKVGHGTAVIHTLLHGNYKNSKPTSEVCSRVKVVTCGHREKEFPPNVIINCLEKAIRTGVSYVNLSIGGSTNYYPKEFEAFKKATEAGIVIVMSAGNNGIDLNTTNLYPQGYARRLSNMYVVSAYDVTSTNKGSWTVNNISGRINIPGDKLWTGTSFAAPRLINQMLLTRCQTNRRYVNGNTNTQTRTRSYSREACRRAANGGSP